MDELGIRMIFNCPGEGSWSERRTFQDRLVTNFDWLARLAEADGVLRFLPRFNTRFAAPQCPEAAYRPLALDVCLDHPLLHTAGTSPGTTP